MVDKHHPMNVNNGDGWFRYSWLFLGIALLLIYLVTASQQYDADILTELGAINHLDTTGSDPAHMLYIRMGVPWYQFVHSLGYEGDALWPMQILNAIFGAGTIMIFAAVLRELGIRLQMVLIMSALVGLSYGFWTHTVDAFFIIPAAFFALTSLLCAIKMVSVESKRLQIIISMLLGLTLAIAVLSYQANLALIPVIFLAGWSGSRVQSHAKLWLWILVGVIFALVAGISWLRQAIVYEHVQNLDDLLSWFFTAHGGIEEGLWRRESVNILSTLPKAWMATILPVHEGLGLRSLMSGVLTPKKVAAQIALGILILTLISTVALLLRRPHIHRSSSFRIAVLWFVIPGLTVLWFDPAEIKLWIIPFFGFWMLLSLIMSESTPYSRYSSLTTFLVSALTLLVIMANLNMAILPNHQQPSQNMALANEAIRRMDPRDLLISSGFDWTNYVSYVSNDYQVFNAVVCSQYFGKQKVRRSLEEAISSTWESGGSVYIVDYFTPDNQIWDEWITPHTYLTPDYFDNFHRVVAWKLSDGQIIWALTPKR